MCTVTVSASVLLGLHSYWPACSTLARVRVRWLRVGCPPAPRHRLDLARVPRAEVQQLPEVISFIIY